MGESRAEQARRALREQDDRRPVCRRDGDHGGSPGEIEPTSTVQTSIRLPCI